MKREATTRESLGLKETETMCEKCTHEEICRREQCGEPYCVIRSCFDFEAKRPRGEWVDEGFYADNVGQHVYRCTHCSDHIVEYPIELGSYCKYCGSDNRCFENDNRKNTLS